MAGIIPADKIEQVRLASDIVDVVSRYLNLKKSGRNYFGLCPFHKEKTPSFSVNQEKQIFHCFGCGEGGNVFNFVMRVEGLSFPESIRMLAKQAGIDIPEEDGDVEQYRQKEALYYVNNLASAFYLENLLNHPGAQKARDYLAGRGIDQKLFKQFGIGWALDGWSNLLDHTKKKSVKQDTLLQAGLVLQNKEGGLYDRFRGRITFAIHNISGQVVGFGARRIINDNSPKYINTPETDIYQKRQVLFNLHQARDAIREQDRVVIVEGYTDVTGLNQRGIANAVATSGTALTPEHAALLHRFTNKVTLMFDGDSAGASAAIRGADILMQHGMDVSICLLPQGQDPDDFSRKNSTEVVSNTLNNAEPYVDYRVRHLKSLNKPDATNERSEQTRDLLGTLAKVNDTIKQAYMVKDLAEKLKIDEATLWGEIKKMQRHQPVPRSDAPKTAPVQNGAFFKSKRGAAEMGLLSSAFLQPELIAKILNNLDTAMLVNPEIRGFFELMENEPPDPVHFDASRYFAHFQETQIAKSLTQLITSAKKSEAKAIKKYAFECIISIQLSVIDQEIQKSKSNLQSATTEQAEQIQQHIMDLYARKKEISSGQYLNDNE